jgi:hypothetical protein
MSMMCEAQPGDLDHAARRVLERLRQEGLGDEALAAAAVAEIGAIWAHLPEPVIAAAVRRRLAEPPRACEPESGRSAPPPPDPGQS